MTRHRDRLASCRVVTLWVAVCFGLAASADGERAETWWPSQWGPEDQLGAMNYLTSQQVLQAARWIRQGEIADMAHTIHPKIPSFHAYQLELTGGADMTPLGSNRAVYNGEMISGRTTAVGTQFDSLGHVGRSLGKDGDAKEIRYYNGFRHSDIATEGGFTKLGIERVEPIFTTGVLVDLVAYKKRNLREGEEITIADLKSALAAQDMSEDDIQPGHAFFFHTGFGRYWDTNKYGKAYMLGTPGFSEAAAHWLADRGVISVGGDQPALEPTQRNTTERMAQSRERVGPIHEILILERGVYIFENLKLDQLVAAKIYKFAFCFGAIPLQGANASTARPFAIY